MADELQSNLHKDVQPRAKVPPTGMDKVDRVKIILEENDNIPPNGQYFGINGRGYLLRAGEEALVPRGIVDILDNAVQTTTITNPSTGRIIGHRDRLRFPYRLMG